MKKVLISLAFLVIISLALIYIFIPHTLKISRTVYVPTVVDAVSRHVSSDAGWNRWWRAETAASKGAPEKQNVFVDGNIQYSVANQDLGPIQVKISMNRSEFASTLLVVSLKDDSSALHWSCPIETGNNPVTKIKNYRQAKEIAGSMDRIMERLKLFLSQPTNLYDVAIERSKVTDTILATTRITLNHYPTTSEIYDQIQKLKQYIMAQGAKETNYPMLHVLKTDSNRFETMVAIPVDKKIRDNGDFVYKRMVPGNILVAKVQGGQHSIEKAFNELEIYVKENELVPPAIPFESLETNRLKEPDTTKWITRIYFPIL